MNPLRRKVAEWAEEQELALRATDPRLNRSVTVIHDDGSVFSVNHAFLVRVRASEQPYIVCFSEHNGVMIWHEEDLFRYQQQGRGSVEDGPEI